MKNKLLRFIHSFNPAGIGLVACIIAAIGEVVSLGSILVNMQGGANPDTFNVIACVINVLFYFSIARSFKNARDNNNLYGMTYPLLVLLFFDYIMPLISSILYNGFTGTFVYLLFGFSLVTTICGILYFIFMIRESKRLGRNPIKVLIVLGIIMFVLSFITNIITLYFEIDFLVTALTATNGNVLAITLHFIGALISVIITFLLSIVYLTYPFLLRRLDMYGY